MSSSFDPRVFDDCLLEAVEASQTGFHFEEGGCWGMAAALHDVISSAGVPAQIRVSKSDFVHAWVRAADTDWDYRGSSTASLESVVVQDIEALQALAGAHGVDKDQFESDRAMAGDILKAAMAMSFSRAKAEQVHILRP